jgi:threonine-phosphate decarboxylase
MDNLAFEHGGNIHQMERIYKRNLLDFSANINPLGLPSSIKNALCNNFNKLLHYPDIQAERVSTRIAKYWGIKRENILVGNGSSELIYLIMHTFRPKETLIPIPTFCEYERVARSVKNKIRFIKLREKDNFLIRNLKGSKGDMTFLCNPNNPTGNLIFEGKSSIDKLPAELIIVDEAFMDFLPDEERHTLIWKGLEKSKRVIVLRTFTKFFALPGLRIGYLVAHQDVIAKLRQNQVPWSVNFFAQLAAELILSDKGYIKKTKQFIEKERKFLFNAVANIRELIPFPSVTNFLLVKIGNKNLTSTLLKKRLIQEGILIRDCANFRGLSNKFIRVAIRSHKENLKLLKALKQTI